MNTDDKWKMCPDARKNNHLLYNNRRIFFPVISNQIICLKILGPIGECIYNMQYEHTNKLIDSIKANIGGLPVDE